MTPKLRWFLPPGRHVFLPNCLARYQPASATTHFAPQKMSPPQHFVHDDANRLLKYSVLWYFYPAQTELALDQYVNFVAEDNFFLCHHHFLGHLHF